MGFVDFYEILEISPNANSETIERVFRYLAQRYHPDNQASGDRARFDQVLEAYETLRDPVKRVAYDIEYKHHSNSSWKLSEAVRDFDGVDWDVEIQTKMLSLFNVKRRTNIRDAGVGDAELAHLLECPAERTEFHLWYLREKGWIRRKEDGSFAITVDEVDRASADHRARAAKKFLTDQS